MECPGFLHPKGQPINMYFVIKLINYILINQID